MENLLLKNAAAISGKTENTSILLKGGKIAGILDGNEKVKNAEEINLAGSSVHSGFIDIHNHGAYGVDVNTATAEDLQKVSEFLAAKGVTAWLPTLVPDSFENYQKTIAAIDDLMRMQKGQAAEKEKPSARVLGVHYEGVFANEKMCGALRPEFFRAFAGKNEIDEMPRLKMPNAIHLTTLAPEIENGIELVEQLKKQNWIVSVGHTKADAETLKRAKQAGAKHLTHFFNAMTGLHHRDLGVVGWGLTDAEISFDIIADGVHVAPEMLAFACRSKPIEKVILISDSVAPTGLGDGEFEIWGEKISVADGKTRNERGGIAGSVITMLDAVKRMSSLGFSVGEVSKMASANPAKLLGIEKTHGSIEIGKRADLTALDERGNVKLVLIGGNVAFGDV